MGAGEAANRDVAVAEAASSRSSATTDCSPRTSLLGVTILVLATVRLLWRRHSTLPPWAPGLSSAERTLAHWTERVLYVLLFVMPLTGLWLVLVSDDALPVHVASHIAFFVAVSVHVGLVLKHQLIDRDRLLRRML